MARRADRHQGRLLEAIGAGAFRISGPGGGETAVAGYHSMGANPLPSLTIPAHSFTEIEFTVRGTVAARYLTDYRFGLTDGGSALTGAVTPTVIFGARPGLLLSPGQRDGVDVDGPVTTKTAETIRYRLDAAIASPTRMTYSLTGGFDDPHASNGTVGGDGCAACHRTHSAQGPNVLTTTSTQTQLCFTCHDSVGSGASSGVEGEYTNPAVPANDPTTRSYYTHDALATDSGHTLAADDEFGGRSNRHSQCADCHQPHEANDRPGTMTTEGWTLPGPLDGISAVAVTNGAAGTVPTFTFVDGGKDRATLEYQLCFKCHSGATVLPSNAGFTPSKDVLDKAVEFNPANESYHPIEAAGQNQTSEMAASLAGTSPFKQWNFSTTSTIRCLNCHASADRFDATGPDAGADEAAAAADLAPHTSPNRGILIQNYRDRELKGSIEPYDENDFALCYVCHAEAPFADTSGSVRPDTNFRYHGLHVNGTKLMDKGVAGSDIDQPGIGSGLAVCSECHYRIHSTTFAVNGQRAGSRLVNFAPNVTAPTGLPLSWQPKTDTQDGTCALKCHSIGHRPEPY